LWPDRYAPVHVDLVEPWLAALESVSVNALERTQISGRGTGVFEFERKSLQLVVVDSHCWGFLLGPRVDVECHADIHTVAELVEDFVPPWPVEKNLVAEGRGQLICGTDAAA